MKLGLHRKPYPCLAPFSALSCSHTSSHFPSKDTLQNLSRVDLLEAEPTEPETKNVRKRGTTMPPRAIFHFRLHHKMFLPAKRVSYTIRLNSAIYKKEYSWTEWWVLFFFFLSKNATQPRQQTQENAKVNKADGRSFVEHIKVVNN